MKKFKVLDIIMFVISLILGVLMLIAGIGKIWWIPWVLEFLWGAAHTLGLTFLPIVVWGRAAVVGEILAGVLLILGNKNLKRIGALITLVTMLVAIGWAHERSIEMWGGKAMIYGGVALLVLILWWWFSVVSLIKNLLQK